MKKLSLGIFLSALLMVGLSSCNPKRIDSKLLLNEVLMVNENNYMNDYGIRSPWIEIFNKSYNVTDMAGCYLRMSNNPGDTVTYTSPKGDVTTKVAQRQQAIFFADGEPNRGTYHLNFTLDPEKTTWLGLFDTRMKLLDQVTIPANTLGADHSYARVDDGKPEWEVKGNSSKKYVSPKANNMIKESNPKMEKFAEQDKSGVGMTVSAVSVVFTALLLLYLSFRFIGKYFSGRDEKKAAAAAQPVATVKAEEKKENKSAAASDEVYAAIAMALYEMQGGMHDVESGVLTLVDQQSAWSAKSGFMRAKPERK